MPDKSGVTIGELLPSRMEHLKDTLRDVVGVKDDVLGWPLRSAMQRIASEGQGVIVLLRPDESPRDLMDSVLAVRGSGHEPTRSPQVVRTYGIGAQILRDLGVSRMRVLSAPKQLHGISGFDLEVVEYVDGEQA